MAAVRTTVMQPAYAIAGRPRKGRVSRNEAGHVERNAEESKHLSECRSAALKRHPVPLLLLLGLDLLSDHHRRKIGSQHAENCYPSYQEWDSHGLSRIRGW